MNLSHSRHACEEFSQCEQHRTRDDKVVEEEAEFPLLKEEVWDAWSGTYITRTY